MDNLNDKLKTALSQLIGKECWGVVAGSGTGTVVSFQIGSKLARDKPIDNPQLSEDVRNYEGEYCLFIECVWRLESKEEVMCGAWDDNSADGKMLQGLNMLVGKRVTDLSWVEPAWDLAITFSNNLQLKVFCDQVNEEDQIDNYMVFTPTDILTVGTKSVLEFEQR